MKNALIASNRLRSKAIFNLYFYFRAIISSMQLYYCVHFALILQILCNSPSGM